MNILFFTYDFPYPTNSGGKTRAYNLLKFAKAQNKISLFSFTREFITEDCLRAVKAIGVTDIVTFPRKRLADVRHVSNIISRKHSIFYSLYFDKKIKLDLIKYVKENHIDIIQYESFYTAFYLSNEIKHLGIKQLYGSENIEHLLYSQYVSEHVPSIFRIPYGREVLKIKNEEMLMYQLADTCLGVTDNEVKEIKKENKQVYKVANGVDLHYFTFGRKEKHESLKILFVGNFSYFPNVSAVRFFYENVFTKLTEKNLEFLIVGKYFQNVKLPKDSRIKQKEYVEDIHKIYQAADIFVSPVSIGGGTNFKILESMASGTPVLSLKETGISIGAKEGEEILFADKETFLTKMRQLIADKKLQERLAKNARLFIEKNYSWEVIGKELEHIWKEVGTR